MPSKIKYLFLSVALVVGMTAACGSDPVKPTSESVAQQPTVAATTTTPKSAPDPTATALPEPTERVTKLLSSNGWTPIEMPPELAYKAEPLDAAEVESIWTETISGARHYIAEGAIVIDTCADGTGFYVQEASRTGLSFTWEVKKDPG